MLILGQPTGHTPGTGSGTGIQNADVPVALTGQRLRHSWPHLFGRQRSSTTTAIRLDLPDMLLLSLPQSGWILGGLGCALRAEISCYLVLGWGIGAWEP